MAKLNSTGSALIWSTYLGGTSPTYANAVATDGAGNVFVTGSTISGAGFPVTLTNLPWTTNTNTNVFLTKISDATAACSTLTRQPRKRFRPAEWRDAYVQRAGSDGLRLDGLGERGDGHLRRFGKRIRDRHRADCGQHERRNAIRRT